MKTINANDYVWVKLTEEGLDQHKSEHDKVLQHMSYRLPKIDQEGWAKFQLWDLMNTFGSKMFCGSRPMFEDNNILLTRP